MDTRDGSGLALGVHELTPFLEGDDLPEVSLPRAKAHWFFGEWPRLAALDLTWLETDPDRAIIALLVASAHQQLGSEQRARQCVRKAQEWNCPSELIAKVLIAGVHNTLGRAAALKEDGDQIARHFGDAIAIVGTDDSGLVSHARSVREMARLGLLPQAARLVEEAVETTQNGSPLRPAHERLNYQILRRELALLRTEAAFTQQQHGRAVATSQPDSTPEKLIELAEGCFNSEDPYAAIDSYLSGNVLTRDEKFQLCLCLADQFFEINDNLTGLNFVVSASDYLSADPMTATQQKMLLSKRMAERGRMDVALDMAVQSVTGQLGLPTQKAEQLLSMYNDLRLTTMQKEEHGHDLLIAYLNEISTEGGDHEELRGRVMIEVGSTREDVPGQGSTRKLAERSAASGIHFITVDMDPHNTLRAQQTLNSVNEQFEAVTQKGEEYLENYQGALDFVFLDAYDFDHGKHSKLRQSRYRKYLGNDINDDECHRMHLSCAEQIERKLSTDGVVCIDDTWTDENGNWCAKGTLAVPYLLKHGFEVIAARNRAVLLQRAPNVRNK